MDGQQRLCGSEETSEWLINAQLRKGDDWVGILHELVPKVPLPPETGFQLVTTSTPARGFVTKV